MSSIKGSAHGTSTAATDSESYVTRWQDLPTQMYTLEETLFELAGQLAALPRRDCIVRYEDQAPVRTRTQDLTPPFRSPAFKEAVLPLAIARVNRLSVFARPVAVVDAEIAARAAELLPAEHEPDFTAHEPRLQVINGRARR